MEEYKEKVLKAMRDYEKQFDPVEQYEIRDVIEVLYEIIRVIEPQKKKEIRNQIECIREFLEDHQENWYVYETLQDKLRQLEIMLEQEQVI